MNVPFRTVAERSEVRPAAVRDAASGVGFRPFEEFLARRRQSWRQCRRIVLLAQIENDYLKADHLSNPLIETQAMALRDEDFWSFIQMLNGVADEDDIERLAQVLAQRPREHIVGFEAALTLKLYELDTQTIANWYAKNDDFAAEVGVSDDVFLYARCAAAAAGQSNFEQATRTATLPTGDVDQEDGEFLLTIAESAASLAGYEWSYDLVPLSYETGSNDAEWQRK